MRDIVRQEGPTRHSRKIGLSRGGTESKANRMIFPVCMAVGQTEKYLSQTIQFICEFTGESRTTAKRAKTVVPSTGSM